MTETGKVLFQLGFDLLLWCKYKNIDDNGDDDNGDGDDDNGVFARMTLHAYSAHCALEAVICEVLLKIC